MTIDNLTIITSGIVLLVALVAPMVNIFFRQRRRMATDTEATDGTGTAQVPVSIVITVHDKAMQLEKNLPAFLTQDYPAGYEVIVVVSSSDDSTDDVLKQFANYPNLYTTFIPSTSRYISRRKLAITIGVKAAKHEWVLLTDAECMPPSANWLKAMTRQCAKGTDMVTGYSNYGENTSPYKRFYRLHDELYLIRQAQRGTPYRTTCSNLLFRKSMFMTQRGFDGNLTYVRGEYDFLVNKYATNTNTALELAPEAWLTEDEPTRKSWRNRHLFYMETRKHLQRSMACRLAYNTDMTMMHLTWLAIMAAGVVAAITSNWIIAIATLLATIITVTFRSLLTSHVARMYNLKVSPLKLFFYEISTAWSKVIYLLRYRMADKNNFICHKI